jgi:ribonuclease BN (tRNA processing enzyme)
VDDDVLLDAGSGVGELTQSEMGAIRHIFLTHSHLDHVGFIPLLLDSIFEQIDDPVVIHARETTLQAFRQHIFNGVIWPDFSRIPTVDRPVVRLQRMEPGDSFDLGDNRRVTMLPATHAVPAAAYLVTGPDGANVAYSGDCTTNDDLWEQLNELPRLDHLIVEAAFDDDHQELARLAGHYTPAMLAADLPKLRHFPALWITHRMPDREQRILDECRAHITDREVGALVGDERLAVGGNRSRARHLS